MNDPHPRTDDEDIEGTTPEGGENGQNDSEATQVSQLKDQLLRALAEAENTRRRAQKERDDTAKYAMANFAREMLNVADNFRRAIEVVPRESTDPAVKNIVTGVEAIERQLQAALERFGIRELDPLGQPFDPNFHRVMMEVEDPGHPPGTVVKVMQAGYVIHDRLLREALVAVSKGANSPVTHIDTSA